jgi:AcrR family transcriptional regulator
MMTHVQQGDVDTDAVRERPRRLGGRSARIRAAVLDATLTTLAEDGDAFGIPHVAARAGVHETSIYRRWGTRDALIVDAITSRIGEEIPLPDTGTLRGDLVTFLERSIQFLASPLGTQLVRATATTTDIGNTDMRQAYWPGRLDRLGEIFTRAVARGEIPAAADWRLAAEMLFAPLYFRLLITHTPLETALAERIADLLVRALAAGGGEEQKS